jgi:hypothetical protein
MMGLFNWVFKGVQVEKRKSRTHSPDAVVDLQHVSVDSSVSADDGANDIGGGLSAASILFENTERQQMGQSGYQYGQAGMQAGGQYGNGGAQGHFGASAINGASYGNRNILVVTPSSNNEVNEIVSNLRNGDACIVCLEGLDIIDAQRRLDFLSGVIHALNGNIKRLNANTYVLTPTGIGVKKQQ